MPNPVNPVKDGMKMNIRNRATNDIFAPLAALFVLLSFWMADLCLANTSDDGGVVELDMFDVRVVFFF